MRTIIVGGVAGGASAAARLRRLDEEAEIIMIERGNYISYANCGLPYYVGGDIQKKDALTLQTPQGFSLRFNADVRVNSTVLAVDAKNKTVTVSAAGKQYTESFDNLILSPGAVPMVPQFAKIDAPGIFTVRTIDDAVNIKQYLEDNTVRRALVIGGGYIGIEMAENLTQAGALVTIAELSDHLIATLDNDVACEVHNYLAIKGLDVKLGTAVTSLKKDNNAIIATFSSGSYESFDMVIVAVGVRPDTGFLQGSGIELNAYGGIVTNKNMRTNFPYIYAVGDAAQVADFITGEPTFMPLAGPANRQGRIAADNVCGIDSRYNGSQGSAVVKIFDMTAAVTGLSENAAKGSGIDYGKIHLFSASNATYYPGASFMSIKVIFENKSGRILGAQIAGFTGVDKRCDVFAVAVRHKLTAADLIDLELCYAPPYSSAKEPVNMAGFMIENLLSAKVKNFYVEDLHKIAADLDIQRVDTRTEWEFKRGSIPGFVNIPLHTLRDSLHLLDKSKPVYVTCQSGQRSYMAARILTQNGYDAYNLSGGYRLYEAVNRKKQV